MKFILCMIYLLGFFKFTYPDCLEGEEWFEKCKSCRCVKQQPICEKSRCMTYSCMPGVAMYGHNYYCSCTKNSELICVNAKGQFDLHEKQCKPNTYFYNSNNYCSCESNRKTFCMPLKGYLSNLIGSCYEGEFFIDDCYNCSCTRTLFRYCEKIPKCSSREVKPGKCPIIENYYNNDFREICLSLRKQDCYTDYECEGNKKCCQITDCFMRCVNPL